MTPYRRVIVVAAQTGIPPVWIAHELNTSTNSIKSILSQERARGEAIPRYNGGPKDLGLPRDPSGYQRGWERRRARAALTGGRP